MDAKTIRIPIRLDSVNKKSHWATGYKKNKRLAFAIQAYLKVIPYRVPYSAILPCQITLTRISPRSLDQDNLIASFKHTRDTIAGYLIPGLQAGRADSDERIQWNYDQRKGEVSEYAIEIKLEKLPC